jgi:TetR/AcrR family transcriptional regulator, cholesterol catabolism regulator
LKKPTKSPRVKTSFTPSEAPADSRREILDCAARLFRTQGYTATNLRDIAAAAGMRAASLYHHFASKDHIVIEVLNRGVQTVFDEVRHSVAALGEDANFEQLINTAVAAHLRSLLELHDYTSANTRIFGQVPAHVREATVETRADYDRFWISLLRRCANQGAFAAKPDLNLLRLFLFGAMNGTLEWYRANGRRSVEEIAEELARVFLRGAGARLHRRR